MKSTKGTRRTGCNSHTSRGKRNTRWSIVMVKTRKHKILKKERQPAPSSQKAPYKKTSTKRTRRWGKTQTEERDDV